MPHRLIKTIDGKRGSFLVVFGFLFMLLGLTNITIRTVAADRAFMWVIGWSRTFLGTEITVTDLGYVWAVCGAISFIVGIFSKSYSKFEHVAYALMGIPPTIWSFCFLVSAIAYQNPTGFRGTVAYFTIGAMVYFVSGWTEPKADLVTVREGD